jgi:hypothetical protein
MEGVKGKERKAKRRNKERGKRTIRRSVKDDLELL